MPEELRMKRKSLFFVTVALLFTVLFFYGCKKGAASTGYSTETVVTAAPGQFPLTESRAELTVLISKPPYVSDLNQNQAAAWYEELTNVHVKYIHVPYENSRASTNLLIASGEYPDIIMNAGLSSVDAINYGGQGILIPINDLIDKEGYFFKEAAGRIPELTPAMQMPDGNIYGLPNINQAFHTFYNTKAWINEDWLKKLNLAVPATTEEFYEVLKAFKTRDPNGNGKADEIPMMGYYTTFFRSAPYVFLLNSFVYFNPGNYLAMENGKVTFVANTGDFREGLRYVARLVDEGLIDKASFTQSADQAKQIGTNPNAPLIGVLSEQGWWPYVGMNNDTADHRAYNYTALSPLKGPKGVQLSPVQGTGFSLDFAQITDKARDPVLAFRWLEGLYSDEATRGIQLGVKGTLWDDPDPGAQGINQKPALYKVLTSPSDESPYWAPNIFLGNRSSDFRLGQQMDWSNPLAKYDQEPKLYRETLEKYYPYRPKEGQYLPLVLHHTAQENSDLARLSEQINTYTLENIMAFITGNKNLDRDWDSYTAEFRRLNLDRYLQFKQTAYDRQYGKK
ncbi:ABC transporter substrate-binding protein [Spirochaetia bacterium]|nr:ABC transporter substrate-binding protein [Spirochaetia bacterium]